MYKIPNGPLLSDIIKILGEMRFFFLASGLFFISTYLMIIISDNRDYLDFAVDGVLLDKYYYGLILLFFLYGLFSYFTIKSRAGGVIVTLFSLMLFLVIPIGIYDFKEMIQLRGGNIALDRYLGIMGMIFWLNCIILIFSINRVLKK